MLDHSSESCYENNLKARDKVIFPEFKERILLFVAINSKFMNKAIYNKYSNSIYSFYVCSIPYDHVTAVLKLEVKAETLK